MEPAALPAQAALLAAYAEISRLDALVTRLRAELIQVRSGGAVKPMGYEYRVPEWAIER